MLNHNVDAIIVTCIDFRLQEYIDGWLSKNFQPKTFDRVALGGGVKNLKLILGQVKIAKDLHHIKKVVLVNHEDCGAYGKEGNYEKHCQDLLGAKARVKTLYPDLKVMTFYLHLNGNFEEII